MSIRNRRTGLAAAAALLVAALVPGLVQQSAEAGPPAAKKPDRPTRVVQIVLDQLRPEFIDRFNMNNVKRLMRGGASYPNAYLGHMASETVVSHNVMTSGQLPKHMGWSDEWYRDSRRAARDAVATAYVTGSMSAAQFDTLINAAGYPKLADYLHAKFPEQDRRRDRREELRRAHHGRAGRRHADHLRQPPSPTATATPGQPTTDLARSGRRQRAGVHRRAGVQPLLRRRRPRARLRHAHDVAGVDVPGRGQPRRARHATPNTRRRRLGDRRGIRGHGARGLERAAADLRRHRQGRPHVGRPERRARRTRVCDPDPHTHMAEAGQGRRRAGRPRRPAS